MIVKGICELVYSLLSIVFSPVQLPQMPEGVQNVFDELLEVLKGSVGLASVFLDFNVIKWLIPVVLVVANFEKVWNMIMFILRKIPFLGIE